MRGAPRCVYCSHRLASAGMPEVAFAIAIAIVAGLELRLAFDWSQRVV